MLWATSACCRTHITTRISLILLGLLGGATMAAAEDFDYCTLKDKCGEQTMCTFKSDTPGMHCTKYEDHLFTLKEKQAMLDKHNNLRAQLQTGKVPNHPAAKVMPALTWSLEMEQLARRWALQCQNGYDDKCRHSKDGTSTGQNIYKSDYSRGFRGLHLQGVQLWFEENKLYKPEENNEIRMDIIKEIRHYTQLVWSKTTHVGCERTYYVEYKHFTELTVCVYHPAGNTPGQAVYDMLEPGVAGQLTEGPGPRPGETGFPEHTVLVSPPAPTGTGVKQHNCITMLLGCLIFALRSAIFTEDL